MQRFQKSNVLYFYCFTIKTNIIMQTKITNRFSVFLIMLLFTSVLVAQEEIQAKKIVVTIKGTDANGYKVTKTVTKSGKDAESFDVEKYINENKKDLTNTSVQVGDKEQKSDRSDWQYRNLYTLKYKDGDKQVTATCFSKPNPQGFLGVCQETDNDEDMAGARISITRNSGAAKAGLKNDDVIIQLNETPVKSFHDISVFMKATKPNDKIQVKYMRNGVMESTTAMLGQPQDAWQNYSQEKEACLGVYTSANRGGTQKGAIINDFMEVSAAKEGAMVLGDVITKVNGVSVKNHQELWDEIAKYKSKQTVTVSYLRNDAPLQIQATLKACRSKSADETVILVPKTQEETQKINVSPNFGEQRTLKLENFNASPNPTQDMVNIKFQGEAVPTSVSLYDLGGKVLYQQTLNDFNGDYNQRFDLNAYAKGVVVVQVLQGEKVFAKQIIVN
jgi:PDZ domain-containing secreted protein